MINARSGQGRFREQVRNLWGNKCAVLGITTNELLRASHIKPWEDCETKTDKLNPNNGIFLCAHLDALFDEFLISFDNDGKLLISTRIVPETRKILQLDGMKLRQELKRDSYQYLEHHRQRFRALQDVA
jgi:predicted restriction endonuclease